MSKRGGVALALAGLAAASLVYCSPFLIHPSTRVSGDAGDPIVIAYHVTWVAQHLGTRHVWNPPFFHPTPNVLAYSDHQFGQAALAWPAVAAGLSPVLIVNLLQWLAFLLTSLVIFWWLLDSGLEILPSALASATVTYGAWRVLQLSHPQLLFMPFLPLALLCYARVLQRRRSRALAWAGGAALACQTLFTPSLTVFTLPLVGVWLVSSAIAERRIDLRSWLAVAASLLVVVAVNLPIAAHYWELGAAFERGPVEIGRFSVGWRDWLSVPASHWIYGDLLDFATEYEKQIFPGLGFLVVVALGVVGGRASVPALVTVLIGVWASTGPSPSGGISLWHLPYDVIVSVIPGGRHVRVPARFYPLLAVVVAPIVAAGWQQVFTWIARRLTRRALAGALTVLLAVLAIAEALPGTAAYGAAPNLDIPALPAELASGGVLFVPLGNTDVETKRMWRARRSGLPIVNGYSGHHGPLWMALRVLQATDTDDAARRALYSMLLQFGVDTIIVEAPTPALVDPGLLRHLGGGVFRIPSAIEPPRLDTIALAKGAGLLVPEAGWSYPEMDARQSWVWSLDRRTTLLVPMDGTPVREMTLNIRRLLTDQAEKNASVELRWNGRSLGAQPLPFATTPIGFTLPEAATRPGWTQFELWGPTPIAVPDSPDKRRLGMALYEITLR